MRGFEIICRSCGVKMIVVPGDRNQEAEPIRFGTAAETYTYMSCRCGNAIEDDYHWEFENEEDDGTLVDRWIDVSRKTVDESTAYGNDCPGGRCEW